MFKLCSCERVGQISKKHVSILITPKGALGLHFLNTWEKGFFIVRVLSKVNYDKSWQRRKFFKKSQNSTGSLCAATFGYIFFIGFIEHVTKVQKLKSMPYYHCERNTPEDMWHAGWQNTNGSNFKDYTCSTARVCGRTSRTYLPHSFFPLGKNVRLGNRFQRSKNICCSHATLLSHETQGEKAWVWQMSCFRNCGVWVPPCLRHVCKIAHL